MRTLATTLRKSLLLLILCTLFLSCNGQTKKAQQGVDTTAVKADTTMPAVLVGNDNIRYGYPGGKGVVLTKQFYVILFDTTTLVPEWVTYHLTKEELQGTANRKNDFRPDPDLPEGRRSELQDYKNSGYDRGHMAPAADFKRSEEAMSETFFLSNMAPQRPNLNRITWSHLEDEVRSLVDKHGSIWIFTGPLYLDSVDQKTQPVEHIGPDNVAVPTHFFKVILCEHSDGQREMFAFIMKNQIGKLTGTSRDYIVSVRKAEELSGLNFFHRLADDEETRLETTAAANWPVQ
jgi:endonuclease G